MNDAEKIIAEINRAVDAGESPESYHARKAKAARR